MAETCDWVIINKLFFQFTNNCNTCFSENLFRTMADLLVSEGYAAAGYEYINVDDCWLEKERGFNNELVPDRQRFPRGIRSLSDYVSKLNRRKWILNLWHIRVLPFK